MHSEGDRRAGDGVVDKRHLLEWLDDRVKSDLGFLPRVTWAGLAERIRRGDFDPEREEEDDAHC